VVDVIGDLERARLWERALDGEQPWSEIMDGFQSTVDWRGGFYRELMDFYPEAKVLLSVRDATDWERSMRQTVWAVRHGESLIRLLSSAQAHVDPRWRAFLRMIDRLVWEGQGTFASGHPEPHQLIDTMRRHSEEVKRNVPAERLLVSRVGAAMRVSRAARPGSSLSARQRQDRVSEPHHRRVA
jgi:hypothetical protein